MSVGTDIQIKIETMGFGELIPVCPMDWLGVGYPSIYHDHHREGGPLYRPCQQQLLKSLFEAGSPLADIPLFIATPRTVGRILSHLLLPAFPSCR